MEGFAPGFGYDVFISYSHVDNEPLSIDTEEPGWVSTFVDILTKMLVRKLGRRESVHIWMDRRLQGNKPFPKDIERAVTTSALLLPIISEGYLASDWCRIERDLFVGANPDRATTSRIFPVHTTDMDYKRMPEAFTDLLGYPFFKKDREDAPPRTLCLPVFDPKDKYYFERIDDLSRDIVQTLKDLRQEDVREASAIESAPIATGKTECVFLAEVTADLEDVRDNVRRHLQQAGVKVLPETYYDRSPSAYQDAMARDLSHAALFVQLLGRFVTPKTHDLPGGYEGLQLDLAKAAGVPILRWHSQDLDLSQVRDAELLEREEVMVMGLEDFKREIEKTLRLFSVQTERPLLEDGGFVLVDCKTPDLGLADEIARTLEQQNVGYEIIDETVSLPDVTEEEDYDAFLIIYGAGDPEWVQQQIRQCRRIMLRRRDHPPVCGVFLGSMDTSTRLRIKPPRFYFIDDVTHPIFRDFVEKVHKRSS